VEAAPQQPAIHGAVGEQVNVHSPFASQPALLAGQSPGAPQPHCPPAATASHASPLDPAAKPAVHDEHVPPLFPHAVVPVPAWHVPPVAAEQQPPWHGCEVLHEAVHALMDVSQAIPAGQSAADWHPHLAAGAVPRQSDPLALPAHTAHAGCPVSQAAAVVPVEHVPAALQHPPLHAEAPVLPHAVEHCPAAHA
jgi:hypothetical protein